MTMTNEDKWSIYYLPHARRESKSGKIKLKGKVGLTKKLFCYRKSENKFNGLDVTDYKILVSDIKTLEEAERLEIRYQQLLRCEDHRGSEYWRDSHTCDEKIQKCRDSKLGDKNPAYGKPAHNRGVTPKKYECIHCGLSVTKGNLTRWHNDNCKAKK